MAIVMNMDEVRDYIATHTNAQTRYYVGADSSAFRKFDPKTGKNEWFAEYTLAFAVHRHTEGGIGQGVKCFGESVVERVYDKNRGRPAGRLMRECVLLSEFFLKLYPLLEDKEFIELHMDISKDKKNGSSCIVEQAIGYLKGICGNLAVVKVKNDAHCASFLADRLTFVLGSVTKTPA